MPLHDWKCPTCDVESKDVWSVGPARCTKCGQFMQKQPSAPAFAIKGYSAKNGYAKERG